MKNKLNAVSIFALCLLVSLPILASEEGASEEIQLLRKEIQQTELVLATLKDRLKTLEETHRESFQISLTTEGILLDGKVSTQEQLKEALEDVPKETAIVLRVDPKVTHQQLISLMEFCEQAGFNHVAVSTLVVDKNENADTN